MSWIEETKTKIYKVLEPDVSRSFTTKMLTMFIMTIILLNVLSVVIMTVPNIPPQYQNYLQWFDIFSVLVFTVEYLLRIWTCTIDVKYRSPLYGRIRFMLTPLLLIDLIAILPFYLPFFVNVDLRFLRILRLLRIFKMTRYSSSFKVFGTILKEKKEEIVISLVIVMLLLVVSSSLMYFVENESQPNVFSSIPATMWWAIATLSTVGYGDVYPITPLGRILGGIVALLGISMFALPTGILASGFVEEMQKRKVANTLCPHCGRNMNIS